LILVDTSVWVDHFRKSNSQLAALLGAGAVLGHLFVLGELSVGNLRDRKAVLGALSDLPQAPMAQDQEVIAFIENHRLHGRGLGYIDVHLLASASLHPSASIWTKDKRFLEAAATLGLARFDTH
jgi:predicted nucleic acid-binding protein